MIRRLLRSSNTTRGCHHAFDLKWSLRQLPFGWHIMLPTTPVSVRGSPPDLTAGYRTFARMAERVPARLQPHGEAVRLLAMGIATRVQLTVEDRRRQRRVDEPGRDQVHADRGQLEREIPCHGGNRRRERRNEREAGRRAAPPVPPK